MAHRILLTGSSGLIGTALAPALEAAGFDVRRFDIRAKERECGDIRDPAHVQRAMASCDGIIHLAAISRVHLGEQDPALCWSTNVDGLQNVLATAASSPHEPWFVFASSREVYGHPDRLPVTESFPVNPVNVYGRTKAAGERMVADARSRGMHTGIVRLSNVYGPHADHPDRVVPAFARAAVSGATLRVDGADHIFDFTHVDDIVRGFVGLAQHLDSGIGPLPPIQLTSGIPTTLGELAALAIRVAGTKALVNHALARNFDVMRFVGRPERAKALLGWTSEISLESGLQQLIATLRETGRPAPLQESLV